ncbi:MAG: hypothetical protein Q8Q74_03925 [Polaromonas sp.]|nr:hypothetical protein [Polaromonas sp.]
MLLAQQMLRLAQQEGRSEWLIAAHYAGANSAYTLGRFAEARQHMEEARRCYRPELDLTLLTLFGEHVMVSALFFGAWSLWMLGRPDESRNVAAEALAIARRMGHPHTLGFAYSCSGVLYRLLEEPAEVAAYGEQLAALAEKHGFAFWQVTAEVLCGWAQACAGQPQGGARIAAAIDAIRAGVFVGAVMYFLEMLAEAQGMLGMHTEQLRVIDEALEIMESIHARHFEAELYRLKGECLLHLGGNSRESAMWLQRARDVAHQQGAITLELRAAASLARLGAAGAPPNKASNPAMGQASEGLLTPLVQMR